MNKNRSFFALLGIIGLLLTGFAASAQEPTLTEPVSVFVLPISAQELSTSLPAAVSNQEPDMPSCQSRFDMNEPCSTLQGQAVEGDFTLDNSNQPAMRLHNGDVINITLNNKPLYPRIPVEVSGTNHDMVILYVRSGVTPPGQLRVKAEYGSNRQNLFAAFPRTGFSDKDVVEVLAHQLRLIMVESDPALEACVDTVESCYPQFINPRNCAKVDDSTQITVATYCDAINIYVLEWDGTAWVTKMYGVYGLLRNEDGTATGAVYMDLLLRMDEFLSV